MPTPTREVPLTWALWFLVAALGSFAAAVIMLWAIVKGIVWLTGGAS